MLRGPSELHLRAEILTDQSAIVPSSKQLVWDEQCYFIICWPVFQVIH